jgi:large subunit ribosomal protein L17e
MVKYSRQPAEPSKSAKCRVDDLRAHYKNSYETARALRGMNLLKAIKYIEDVIAHK